MKRAHPSLAARASSDSTLGARPASRAGVSVARAAALIAVASIAATATGDTIDPFLPTTVTVGDPDAIAATPRLDGARTGQSAEALPAVPTELWRRSTGTVEAAPLVDGEGAIYLLTTAGELTKVSADGKELWHAKLTGSPVGTPILTSDGSVATLTSNGFVVAYGSDGRARFSTPVGCRNTDPLVPVADGGVAVLASTTLASSLVTLDGDGAITSETKLTMHASFPPIPTADGWLVVEDDGAVMRVQPPNAPRPLGSFAGLIEGGAVLADERTLLAVMHERLLALDLKTGVLSARASINAVNGINGPPTVDADRTAYFTTTDGLLMAVDHTGKEVFRATLERSSAAYTGYSPGGYYPGAYPPGYGYGYYTPRPDPPVLAGADGRFAFLRNAGRFGLVDVTPVEVLVPGPPGPNGEKKDISTTVLRPKVTVVNEHVCQTPVAVVPAGDKRVVVACREGIVALFGE
ncbi:MAG: PQQ-binding-like beta-propeller repeat protein [Polyangiaceae bacterium]